MAGARPALSERSHAAASPAALLPVSTGLGALRELPRQCLPPPVSFQLGPSVLHESWSSVLCQEASSEANVPPSPQVAGGVLLVLRLALSLNTLLSNNICLLV